jgi:hypothetical protein
MLKIIGTAAVTANFSVVALVESSYQHLPFVHKLYDTVHWGRFA